jgi:hypothetical protein
MFDNNAEITNTAQQVTLLTKEVLKSCDDEFYQLNAQHWRRMYQAAVDAGFLPMQALELVKASMRSISK